MYAQGAGRTFDLYEKHPRQKRYFWMSQGQMDPNRQKIKSWPGRFSKKTAQKNFKIFSFQNFENFIFQKLCEIKFLVENM